MRSCVSKVLGCLLAAAVAAGGLITVACSTPTLPLPPPAALTFCPPDAGGIVRITGHVSPDAYVLALNPSRCDMFESCGVIVQADAEGLFMLEIQASIGETIEIWQMIGTDQSPRFDLLIQPSGDGGPPPGCPP